VKRVVGQFLLAVATSDCDDLPLNSAAMKSVPAGVGMPVMLSIFA